jgi:hypothetical protein
MPSLASTSGDDTAEAYIKRPWLPDVDEPSDKLVWSGTITAIQPRIRLTRSFDEQSHAYLGCLLRIEGTLDKRSKFWVAVGPGAHAKHQFRIGDQVEGLGQRVTDQRLEVTDLYKVSNLRILRRGEAPDAQAPWNGVPPSLPVYRERSHRRLAGKLTNQNAKPVSGDGRCRWRSSSITGTLAAFGTGRQPSVMDRYYVPSTSPVPHAKFLVANEMRYEEPDWVDANATCHRRPDE